MTVYFRGVVISVVATTSAKTSAAEQIPNIVDLVVKQVQPARPTLNLRGGVNIEIEFVAQSVLSVLALGSLEKRGNIPSGPGLPGKHCRGLAGVRSPVQHALQRGTTTYLEVLDGQ